MNAAMRQVGEMPWMPGARDLIGVREISGNQHEPKILALADDNQTGWINDDETAWCAIFVGGCLERVKVRGARSLSARAYMHWGISVYNPELENIPPGAILVFDRPPNPWQGHVGFADGYTVDGFLKVLGGNQRNSVSIADIHVSRLLDARWPIEYRADLRINAKLPLKLRSGAVSTSEA